MSEDGRSAAAERKGRGQGARWWKELWLALAATWLGLAAAPAAAQCVGPGTPANPSPASEATVPSGDVTFSWSTVSGTGPITYQVLLDGLNVLCTTATTSCSVSGVVGSHTWRVTASNACGSATGGPWTFTVGEVCTAPGAPANVLPQPGTTVNSATVNLTWSAASGTTPITYDVFLDTLATPRCTTVTTICTVTGLSAGAHTWWVRGRNCAGNGALAGPFGFTANPPCEAPGAPALVSPASGASGVGAGPLLQWQAPATGTGPFTYTAYLDDQPVAGCTATAALSCQLAGLPIGSTQRQWRVSATNGCGTASSGVRSFTTCGSAAPVASITLSPTGTVVIGGVQQAQPYVGQQVVLHGEATNGPILEWSWYDFGTAGVQLTTQDVAYTWDSAGTKPVRLKARNCAGFSQEALLEVVVHADVRGVIAEFSWAPSPGAVGVPMTFTASDTSELGSPTAFTWTFPGGVTKTGKVVQHTFACSGAQPVTLVAARGAAVSPATTRTVTTGGEPLCCQPPNRASAPVPANGATVPGGTVTLEWARPDQGTDPLRYDVVLDGLKLLECSDLATRQCVTTVAEGPSTHFWSVIAKNDCGTTADVDTPSEWRFKACSSPIAPDATSFSWSPSGEVVVGGVVQQQPYVGQPVTFSYNPTVAPTTWSWTDYQKSPATVYEGVPSPTVVYTSPGSKKVYLRVSNCAGTRGITQYVTVHADQRPVVAAFTVSPPSPAAYDLVTLTFDTSAAAGSPDQFTVDFGDGSPAVTTGGPFVQHAYPCGRTYRATVTARRVAYGSTATSTPVFRDVPVSGAACSPDGYLLIDIPLRFLRTGGPVETGGLNAFNTGGEALWLEAAVRDTGSGALRKGLPLPPLPPKGSLSLPDLVALLGLDSPRATLWLRSAAPGTGGLPVINAWSYAEYASGLRYGQFLPVLPVWPAADHETTLWITGIEHSSVTAERGRYGSTARLTLVDPTIANVSRTAWGTRKLTLRLYDAATGVVVRTDSINLDTFAGYRHDYLNRIFHLHDGQSLGRVMVRIDVPAGLSALAVATVTDNVTGASRVSAAAEAR